MTEQKDTTAIAKSDQSMSIRFMNHVVQEYGNGVGEVALTNFQKRLAQNYFMAVDDALLKQEQKREYANKSPNGRSKESVPATWANVNMERLARDVVACARIGLDPMENNHISPVLFKNNRTGKYDVGFIIRYKGLELKAWKYGLDCPDTVIVELVYSTDKFRSIKKSATNKIEGYEFEITNEFDRGDIIGGFFYHAYTHNPEKNKLVVMSKKDIDKRKPKYASAEFWGGEVDQWEEDESGKRVKKKVSSDGWYEKMAFKTVYRAAYSAITIDSQKIDDDYRRLSSAENMASGAEFEAEYSETANSTPLIDMQPMQDDRVVDISVDPNEFIDERTGEVIDSGPGDPPPPAENAPPFAVA